MRSRHSNVALPADQDYRTLQVASVQQTEGVPRRAILPRLSAADTFRLAIWAALVTALVETAYCAYQKYCLGQFLFASTSVCWMGPVAQSILFSVLAAPLAFVAWRAERYSIFSFAVMLFSFVAFLDWLLLLSGLHLVAQLLVAIGLATQASRIAQSHADGFMRVVRRSVHWLAAFVLGLGGAIEAGPKIAARWAAAALDAPLQGAPNVLLIVLDTVRADAANLSDANGPTPNLKRIADEGTTFLHASAPAPWTLPSHASMLTGRYPHELSAGWYAPLDGRFPTLAEHLHSRGYLTAGVVGNTRYCSAETGLGRGFIHYEDYRITPSTVALATALWRRVLALSHIPHWLGWYNSPARITALDVNRRFLRWLDGHPAQPFFAMLNYFDAHDPYVPPREFARQQPHNRHQRKLIRTWWGADKLAFSQDEIAFGRSAYEDCIRYLDHELGVLLNDLRQRGLLDNTLLIVTSDHGEQFGDHGLFGHGASLYQPAIDVPLVMRWPSHVPASRRIESFVTLREIPATIAKLIDPDGSAPFPGRPLSRFWNPTNVDSSTLDSAVVSRISAPARHPPCQGRSPVFRGAMNSLIVDGLKYIRNGDGVEELYDLTRDAEEQNNLAGERAHQTAMRELREALDRILQTANTEK